MAFPDDLLELAQQLAGLHPEGPHQASLEEGSVHGLLRALSSADFRSNGELGAA
ncbi:MAG TPA: hypothetical protein VMH80_28545 [Bryobacteraceae bacterium]|nr:hypothetical protein [Bryobacteraceae bacterium]